MIRPSCAIRRPYSGQQRSIQNPDTNSSERIRWLCATWPDGFLCKVKRKWTGTWHLPCVQSTRVSRRAVAVEMRSRCAPRIGASLRGYAEECRRWGDTSCRWNGREHRKASPERYSHRRQERPTVLEVTSSLYDFRSILYANKLHGKGKLPRAWMSYAANSRISATCAGSAIGRGLRGTHGVAIACLAMRSN